MTAGGTDRPGSGPARLGPNRYGKAGIRLLCVQRDTTPHILLDLEVDVALSGDLADTHLRGDNTGVLPTDTMRNTVLAFARDGLATVEDFAIGLARHFVATRPAIAAARVEVARHGWLPVPDVAGRPHPHSFRRDGAGVRTVSVEHAAGDTLVACGVRGLDVLNTSGSEFAGFAVDEFTTLAPTLDRILATSVDARWRYADLPDEPDEGPGGWDARFTAVRECLLDAFAGTYSRSLQQTLYAMGARVIEEIGQVAEVRLVLPNRHHILADLTPFGRDNPGILFTGTDRPYGRIEGTVLRAGVDPDPRAW